LRFGGYPVLTGCNILYNIIASPNKWKEDAEESESDPERDLRCYGAGFEDGRGPRAKECRWPLEAGRNKNTDSPLEPPDGAQSCQYLDFSLFP